VSKVSVFTIIILFVFYIGINQYMLNEYDYHNTQLIKVIDDLMQVCTGG